MREYAQAQLWIRYEAVVTLLLGGAWRDKEPSMMMLPELYINAQATLGESPAWDAKTQTLYWVDDGKDKGEKKQDVPCLQQII